METICDLSPADPVFARLIEQRVAIVGFAPEEETRLSDLFSEAGALCQSFPASGFRLAVRSCDVVLVVVDELRPFRVESFPKPVIAGITPDSLTRYPQWIRNSACDWFFGPGTSQELLTRVTVALHRGAGQNRSKLDHKLSHKPIQQPARAFCVLTSR